MVLRRLIFVFMSLITFNPALWAANAFSKLNLEVFCQFAPKHLQESFESMKDAKRIWEIHERVGELSIVALIQIQSDQKTKEITKCYSDLNLTIDNHLKVLKSKLKPYESHMLEGDYKYAKNDFDTARELFAQARSKKPRDTDALIKEIAAIFKLIEVKGIGEERLSTLKGVVRARLQELKKSKDAELSKKSNSVLNKWNTAI